MIHVACHLSCVTCHLLVGPRPQKDQIPPSHEEWQTEKDLLKKLRGKGTHTSTYTWSWQLNERIGPILLKTFNFYPHNFYQDYWTNFEIKFKAKV